jgi:hypothetical protein
MFGVSVFRGGSERQSMRDKAFGFRVLPVCFVFESRCLKVASLKAYCSKFGWSCLSGNTCSGIHPRCSISGRLKHLVENKSPVLNSGWPRCAPARSSQTPRQSAAGTGPRPVQGWYKAPAEVRIRLAAHRLPAYPHLHNGCFRSMLYTWSSV